jgi:2'-5' RNA ligase
MRLFIAFPLSDEVKTELTSSIEQLSRSVSGVKWVSKENLHLTIRFLGESETNEVPKIQRLLRDISSAYKPVRGKLGAKLGAFPTLARPRVVWASVFADPQITSSITNDIEDGVQELGFQAELKKWTPHITIGRVKEGVRIEKEPIEQVILKKADILLDTIVLFESRLSPSGPTYHKVSEHTLSAELFR